MLAYEPTELSPDDADFGPTQKGLHRFLTGCGHHPVAGPDTFLDRLGFSAGLHHGTDTPPA